MHRTRLLILAMMATGLFPGVAVPSDEPPVSEGGSTRAALVAGAAATADSTAAGAGADAAAADDSHWGPIAPRTEETTVTSVEQGDPAWERAVNLPYNVVFLPLKATWYLVEEGIESASENRYLERVRRLVPLRIGPAFVTPGASYGSQTGFGASLAVDVPEFLGPDNALRLRFSGEQQGSRKATLGVQYHRSAQSLVEVGGGYRSSHNARFYGIGPYTVEDDESYYRREVAWGGVSWHRTLAQDFSVEVGAILSGVSAGGSDHSDEPHLSEEFAGELPTGYRDRSDGSTVSLELAHDAVRTVGPPSSPWRDRARPESGGIRRLRASWFDGVAASKAAFLTWRAEAQQFVPLWHTKRALALRGVLSKIENDRRVGVPFQRLLSNDGADLLRGYPEGRFHGLGLATVSAEYRWPLWNDEEVEGWGADGYLFVDYGQVFDDFEVLQTSRVKGSWGGGVRFGGYGLFLGRIEAGASDEGVEFRLQAEQIFQYAKGGLYSGRDPVPDR